MKEAEVIIENHLDDSKDLTENELSLTFSSREVENNSKRVSVVKRIIIAISLFSSPVIFGGSSNLVEASEKLPPFISGSDNVLSIPSRSGDCACFIQRGNSCNPGMKMAEIGVCFENRWSWPSGCETDVPCDKGASWMCFCP